GSGAWVYASPANTPSPIRSFCREAMKLFSTSFATVIRSLGRKSAASMEVERSNATTMSMPSTERSCRREARSRGPETPMLVSATAARSSAPGSHQSRAQVDGATLRAPSPPQLGDELLAGEIQGVELQPGAEVGADDLRESEDRRAALAPRPGGVGAEGRESLQGGVVEKDLGQRRRLSLPPTLEQPLAHRDQGASNGERGEQPGPEKAADDHRNR